jgi:hypothetical protein
LMAGAIVSIAGANRLADAISGTGVVSGNSTIKLARPWAGATVTGQMIVFMSYEGLADAVFQLKSIIDQAAASADIGMGYLGNYDLAAAGALPPAPADGTGSRMYRISTAATVGSVAYRAGEVIYFDQYLNVWRRMDEALGSGAYANVMSSLTDTTTPDALMPRGAFGVGGGNVFITDANSITASGMYATPATWTGSPNAGTDGANQGYLQHYEWGGGYALQRFTDLNHTFVTQERRKDAGAWSAWARSYSARNILGTVSQSAGIPTGAIIQRGSNANGEFTRFADGSVVATTVTRSAQTNLVSGSIFSSELLGPFPQPVTGIFVHNSFASGSSESVWFGVLTHPNTSLYARAFATNNASSSTYRITTTGYWY